MAAAAWPTKGDPVLIDVSMSITTHGLTGRLNKEKRKLPGQWVLDGYGNPSDDPAVVFNEPKGGLLPIGGIDHGHKGYALGLLVEALTQGLSGHGRADPVEGWAANVYVQVFDPALFGGVEDFTRQTDPVKVERDLIALVPKGRRTLGAHLLIAHGRRICVARKPRCGECPVENLCPKVGVSIL